MLKNGRIVVENVLLFFSAVIKILSIYETDSAHKRQQ